MKKKFGVYLLCPLNKKLYFLTLMFASLQYAHFCRQQYFEEYFCNVQPNINWHWHSTTDIHLSRRSRQTYFIRNFPWFFKLGSDWSNFIQLGSYKLDSAWETFNQTSNLETKKNWYSTVDYPSKQWQQNLLHKKLFTLKMPLSQLWGKSQAY
jgi:hypothetical protein